MFNNSIVFCVIKDTIYVRLPNFSLYIGAPYADYVTKKKRS